MIGIKRRLAASAVAAVAGGAGLLAVATPAQAAVYRCDLDGYSWYCAKVTAIDAGSYLAMHTQPNYTSGHNAYRGHNGNELNLNCWTTGAGDADGHGDRYWFNVDNGIYAGYVNDWYVTTGAYADWSRYIPHC